MALRLLPIARPCDASFAAMEGDAQRRHCAECDKHVHDLSARTEDEARALLRAARGTTLCVRFARDALGNVRFRSAALAAAVSLAACASPTSGPPPAAPTTSAEQTNVAASTSTSTGAGAGAGGKAGASTSTSKHHDEVGDYDMGDMIPDVDDVCPDDPGTGGDDGCPVVPPAPAAPSGPLKP
jgi:hypothetical protein